MAISIPFFGKTEQQFARNDRVNRPAGIGREEAVDGLVVYQKGSKAKVCWGPGKQSVESVSDLVLIVE
ncbi:hypothetical protein [Amantichitinum ursilacus]|uniref:Uncharacterized protein n=1 Tax=Amantichitinum ursilacus TaxID=857265 RepID=A0A0N0XKG6_9NEIS|nr:hypothetical protein [Amantichitinum ursilacus]KPC52245.1 hypothetical protein WG78_14335 [Amantichitinum ursilacus]